MLGLLSGDYLPFTADFICRQLLTPALASDCHSAVIESGGIFSRREYFLIRTDLFCSVNSPSVWVVIRHLNACLNADYYTHLHFLALCQMSHLHLN